MRFLFLIHIFSKQIVIFRVIFFIALRKLLVVLEKMIASLIIKYMLFQYN
jgi:hypothetical protein